MTAPKTPRERAEERHNKLVNRMNDALILLGRAMPLVGEPLKSDIEKLLNGGASS